MLGLSFLVLLAVCDVYNVASAKYIAEVYFVVDNKVVQNYIKEVPSGTAAQKREKALANLQAEIKYFVGEVNHLYKSASTYGLDIEIRSRKLNILNTDIISGTVTEKAGLTAFDTWLVNQKAYANLNYDMALYWTGYDLVTSGTGEPLTAGYAHEEAACDGKRASAIAEFDGTWHTVYVTAHELGHVLGSDHDAVSQGYIMSTQEEATSLNRWKFSSASVKAMQSYLNKLGSCLLKTNSQSVAYSGAVTPTQLDPNLVCQRATRSKDSYVCKDTKLYGGSVPKGDAVCRAIHCVNPAQTDMCLEKFSSEGLTCGANMRCRDGSCKYDASAGTADINPDCIWGDDAKIKITVGGNDFYGTCGDFLSKYTNKVCTYTAVQQKCCESCAVPKTTSTSTSSNCPNGDVKVLNIRVAGKPYTGTCADLTSRYSKTQVCANSGLKSMCCATCAVAKRSVHPANIRLEDLSINADSHIINADDDIEVM